MGGFNQMSSHNLSMAIQHITDLMLKIETLALEKQSMEQILKEKEQKWIQNDTITKQRRIILNYIVKINLSMAFDLHQETSLYLMEQERQSLSSNAYDALLFMISHIFAQNRLPAINYIAEVNHYMSTH